MIICRYQGFIWDSYLPCYVLQQGRETKVKFILIYEDHRTLAKTRETAFDWYVHAAIDFYYKITLYVTELDGNHFDSDLFHRLCVNYTLFVFWSIGQNWQWLQVPLIIVDLLQPVHWRTEKRRRFPTIKYDIEPAMSSHSIALLMHCKHIG